MREIKNWEKEFDKKMKKYWDLDENYTFNDDFLKQFIKQLVREVLDNVLGNISIGDKKTANKIKELKQIFKD